VLVEGSWVVRHGQYYYLFYSGDNCCGPRADYAVMVARSNSAAGPFEKKADPIILQKRGRWIAPGHNSVITDAKGQDWIIYHASDVRHSRVNPGADINSRRVMLIDRIQWGDDGWPVIDGPSEEPSPAPAG
jgi:arabinan endo-1,5-alpha-L-arabinosidase